MEAASKTTKKFGFWLQQVTFLTVTFLATVFLAVFLGEVFLAVISLIKLLFN